jgi:hypothetical protein
VIILAYFDVFSELIELLMVDNLTFLTAKVFVGFIVSLCLLYFEIDIIFQLYFPEAFPAIFDLIIFLLIIWIIFVIVILFIS